MLALVRSSLGAVCYGRIGSLSYVLAVFVRVRYGRYVLLGYVEVCFGEFWQVR